jgi:hypothetical protein
MVLPGAARCIKFSAPPLDLLAVSEHDERVSLFDARRWGSGQTLALGGAVRGAVRGAAAVRSLDVSGLAFSPSVSGGVGQVAMPNAAACHAVTGTCGHCLFGCCPAQGLCLGA